MKKMNNKGAALIWTLMLFIVAAALLACVLPLAAGSMTNSKQETYKQQAYYTAKSVTDMLVEYVVSDAVERTGAAATEQSVGYQLVEKAKAADPDNGYEYTVNGLGDMGSCIANVRFKDNVLYISSTAAYGSQTATLTAKLQKGQIGSSFNASSAYVTGVYPGIRANLAIQTTGTDGVLNVTKGNVLLLAEKDPAEGKDKWPVSSLLMENIPSNRATADTVRFYSKHDVVNHNAIVADENCRIRTLATSALSEEDGNIILDNPGNLFEVNNNVHVDENNYNFYTSQLLQLTGQITIGYSDLNYSAKNFAVGRVIFEGSDVDKTASAGASLVDNSGKGGILLEDYIPYIDNGFSFDYVTVSTKDAIYCDGPAFLRNRGGGVKLLRTNKYVKSPMIGSSYVEIISDSPKTNEDPKLDVNSIYLEGGIASFSLESCGVAGNNAEVLQKVRNRYANAPDSKDSPEYQAIAAAYEADAQAAANGTGAYADKSLLWNVKDSYKGDVVINATQVLDDTGAVVADAEPAQVYVEGSISSMGNIAIGGNVVVNGNIFCAGTVTLTGGVTVNGVIKAEQVYLYDTENHPVQILGSDNGDGTRRIVVANTHFEYHTWDEYTGEDTEETQVLQMQVTQRPVVADTVSGNDGDDSGDIGEGGEIIERPANVIEDGPLTAYTEVKETGKYYSVKKRWRENLQVTTNFSRNVTLRDILTDVLKEAEETYSFHIAEYGAVPSIDASKISGGKLKIDNRNATKASRFYKVPFDLNLSELQLDSYGDTYIVIPKNRQVKLSEITTDIYYSNIFFILEENATLILNEAGAKVTFNTHVYSKERDNGSTLVLGDNTMLMGSIDVDTLEVGNDATFGYVQPNDLSGALKEGYDGWEVLQYERQ